MWAANILDGVWNIERTGVGIGKRPSLDTLARTIERSIQHARNAASRHVNVDQLLSYWNNGRMIVVYEQEGRDRAQYGDGTLGKLSKRVPSRFLRTFRQPYRPASRYGLSSSSVTSR